MNNRMATRRDKNNKIYNEQEESIFEQQNQTLLGVLRDKATGLKNISIEMQGIIKESNEELDRLTRDMGKTDSFYAGTMRKFSNMVEAGGGWNVCYLVLFCVFVFFVIYLFIKMKR